MQWNSSWASHQRILSSDGFANANSGLTRIMHTSGFSSEACASMPPLGSWFVIHSS